MFSAAFNEQLGPLQYLLSYSMVLSWAYIFAACLVDSWLPCTRSPPHLSAKKGSVGILTILQMTVCELGSLRGTYILHVCTTLLVRELCYTVQQSFYYAQSVLYIKCQTNCQLCLKISTTKNKRTVSRDCLISFPSNIGKTLFRFRRDILHKGNCKKNTQSVSNSLQNKLTEIHK